MRISLGGRHQGRRPFGIAAGVLLAAASIAPAARAARPETVVRVRGAVTDASGAAVPGHVARLIKTRTVYKFKAPRSQEQGVEEKRVRTDAEGHFEFEFTLDPSFHAWFVRFYDPVQFDGVKYRLPEDLDITRQASGGGTVVAHAVLQLQPDWPQVKTLIAEYGPASHRGQILRALGIPRLKEPLGEGRELWIFEAAGVSYVIDGDRVVETRRTGTGTPRDAVSPAASPEDPEQAERVNDR